MRVVFIGLFLLIVVTYSCKKEINLEPKLEIISISNDTALVFDTLKIIYERQNIDTYSEIKVFIDNIQCEVFENNGQQLKIIVPYGISSGILLLSHPLATSFEYHMTTSIEPTITSCSPSEGVGGDTLFIKGWGLTEINEKRIVTVNSLPVQIIQYSDTLIKGIVPEGCGSGQIRIQTFRTNGSIIGDELIYHFESEMICDNFKYNFDAYSGNVYPTLEGNTILERNSSGYLVKKDFGNGKYEEYKYTYELIDTIYVYDNYELTGYQTFLIHSGGEEVVQNFFDTTDELVKYYVFNLQENKIVRWEFYDRISQSNDFYLSALNLYLYSGNNLTLDRTVFNPDGTEYYHPIFEGQVDMLNTSLDFNIPGYPLSKEIVWIYNNYYAYHNYYNEFGLLIKRVRCKLGISEQYGTVYEYSYY